MTARGAKLCIMANPRNPCYEGFGIGDGSRRHAIARNLFLTLQLSDLLHCFALPIWIADLLLKAEQFQRPAIRKSVCLRGVPSAKLFSCLSRLDHCRRATAMASLILPQFVGLASTNGTVEESYTG